MQSVLRSSVSPSDFLASLNPVGGAMSSMRFFTVLFTEKSFKTGPSFKKSATFIVPLNECIAMALNITSKTAPPTIEYTVHYESGTFQSTDILYGEETEVVLRFDIKDPTTVVPYELVPHDIVVYVKVSSVYDSWEDEAERIETVSYVEPYDVTVRKYREI